ncbi:MAG: PEP-utilizing enzyme [bacterium]
METILKLKNNIFLHTENNIDDGIDGKFKILEGQFGYDFIKKGKYKEIFEARRNSVKGFGASLGRIRGKCVVADNLFMAKAKMKKGSILIVPYTGPEYLPILKLAKAVVTDTGGITSHAAIVSRELKKPCVIGTKIATKVFKDGDLVEVDANRGIVKIIK